MDTPRGEHMYEGKGGQRGYYLSRDSGDCERRHPSSWEEEKEGKKTLFRIRDISRARQPVIMLYIQFVRSFRFHVFEAIVDIVCGQQSHLEHPRDFSAGIRSLVLNISRFVRSANFSPCVFLSVRLA